MKFRLVSALSIVMALAAAPVFGQAAAGARNAAIPRTTDGHPDFQGIWTNATLTPLERAAALTGKSTLTEAEARAIEKADVDRFNIDRRDGGAEQDRSRAYNNLFIDRGSEFAKVDGVKRTALIIDPADGKIPPMTAEARQRIAGRMRNANRFDSVLDRPLGERCLVGFGSTSGPPMMPVLYNNNYQIVQTPDTVMILVEMVHDVRIVRMNGTHAPAGVRQWLGDSIGHWDGDTLVVDTTNFTSKTGFRGASENMHVVERFTRSDGGTILYKATVDDPTTFSKQWTLEYPFVATAGPIFEYACHEGNYAMTDILGGARKDDAEKGK